MNFRSRALTRLAYELECTLKIPDVCEGGQGEPCHANWQLWGKNGGGEKAPDWAIASGCRACHRALDQGSKLPAHLREHYWMRGHVATMNELWGRGLIQVNSSGWREITMAQARREFGDEAQTLSDEATRNSPPTLQQPKKRSSKRGTHCTAAANQVKRPTGGFAP